MRLILTRHGETIENIKKLHQGWLPGKLSKKGLKQAKLLARRLKNIKIDVIYTSDLNRSLETTKAIAKFHKNAKLIKAKLLREMNHGVFNGTPNKLKYWKTLNGGRFDSRPEKGESLNDIWKRVKSFYKKLVKNNINDDVLIVAHSGTMCCLQSMICGKGIEYALKMIKIKNTAVTEIELNPKGNSKILCLNCDKHLQD